MVLAIASGQEVKNDCQLQSRPQGFSEVGVLLGEYQCQPIEHLIEHHWLLPHVVGEVTTRLSEFSHKVVILAKQCSSGDSWPHQELPHLSSLHLCHNNRAEGQAQLGLYQP